MHIETTPLDGLLVLEPKRFGDVRGWFVETWNERRFAEVGIDTEWVQDNCSLSVEAATVRGLHFQAPPHAQAKLVRCARGAFFDVTVDIRRGSPTYGQWFGIELSAENGLQVFVPPGFAHGFATRSPNTEVFYKCSHHYVPASERSLAWNDPDLAIDWGVGSDRAILSERDSNAGPFTGFESPFDYAGESR